jgi:hypothetical protein
MDQRAPQHTSISIAGPGRVEHGTSKTQKHFWLLDSDDRLNGDSDEERKTDDEII